MKRLLSIYRLLYPGERHIWVQVRIIHETKKALLVDNGRRFWVPKAMIGGIRLRNNVFDIYVKEGFLG